MTENLPIEVLVVVVVVVVVVFLGLSLHLLSAQIQSPLHQEAPCP